MVIKYKQTFKVIWSKFISSINTEPGHILVLGKPHDNEVPYFQKTSWLSSGEEDNLDVDSSSTTYMLWHLLQITWSLWVAIS